MEGEQPKETHTELATVSVKYKDGKVIDLALGKMVPYKIGIDSADDPFTTHYFVYYDSPEKFSSEEPAVTVHHSVEITFEEYKRLLPIYNSHNKRVPGVDTATPYPKARKLEIVKYILKQYPNSTIYANHVKNHGDNQEDLPEDKWNTLVDLDEPYDVVDEVSNEEIANFFLHELLGICGCGMPDRIKFLTVYWLNLVEHDASMVKRLMQAPYGGAVTTQVDTCDYIYSFVYMLNDKGLIEHGFVISNPMITELGRMVRDAFKADLEI